MRKKLKDSGGLTMIEMLCATVILVLLCLMTGTGIQMALKNYHTLTAESETQLLLSSLTDALSDKLRYCVVTVDTSDNKSYSIGEVIVDSTTHRVTVGGKELLPDGAYGSGRWEYAVEKVKKPDGSDFLPLAEYKGGKFTVNFKVVWKADGRISAQTPEGGLIIRCLNPVKKEKGSSS